MAGRGSSQCAGPGAGVLVCGRNSVAGAKWERRSGGREGRRQIHCYFRMVSAGLLFCLQAVEQRRHRITKLRSMVTGG